MPVLVPLEGTNLGFHPSSSRYDRDQAAWQIRVHSPRLNLDFVQIRRDDAERALSRCYEQYNLSFTFFLVGSDRFLLFF